MEIVLGSFSFNSNFECGNLAKVIPIHLTNVTAASSTTAHKSPKPVSHNRTNDTQIDYEFNLWTKPDCGGTEFENNNRTWFCFCIKGGTPGERVQLSVMNLNKQSKLYSQGMQPVVRCVGDCVQSSNWERIKERCSYRSEDNSTVVSWVHTVPLESRGTYYAFTYPYTYSQLQSLLSNLDDKFSLDPSDIYYCRELLNKSLDGSRVDLVTITSQLGKQEEREDRLPGLFPDWNTERPNRFQGKKVVFVSARVHPGETPSSFVLNGFINFVISSDARAKKLRDIFVFKIIPMLNPDGVIRGHYRTDQRGVNLNRVYSNPSPELHPTIYAAKMVILYYHYGMQADSLLGVVNDALAGSSQGATSEDAPLQKSSPPLLDEDTCHSFSDAVINKSKPSTGIPGASAKPHSILDAEEPSVSGWDCSSNMSADSSCRATSIQNHWEDMHEESSNKFYPSGETGVTSMFGCMSPLHDFKILPKDPFKSPCKTMECLNFMEGLSKDPPPQSHYMPSVEPEETKSLDAPTSQPFVFHSGQGKVLDNPSSLQEAPISPLAKARSLCPSPFLPPCSSVLKDSKSNLFMYMDFHGHASKRGIFMYGNWFEDPMLMVECMLYPKLLSLNCSNFEFGACNFSERNMYHRDRRDGMSKEGSGRVSVMRSTGLVRSYTLECNYNTGRVLSTVPSVSTPTRPLSFHGVPPKYTPTIFEDCGLKLGVCLHDLAESDDSAKTCSSKPYNLNTIRSELFNSLSTSAPPRVPNSSCSAPGLSPSPKMGAAKNPKDSKCASEDRAASTSRAKASPPSLPHKLPSLHSYSPRRPSLSSSTLDAENQEPQLARGRTAKAKSLKAKKDPSNPQGSPAKLKKKLRYKSGSSKKGASSLFKDIGETSPFPPDHTTTTTSSSSSSSSKLLVGDGASQKADASKLLKKLEKARKQPRPKAIKFGASKKLKNISGCEAASVAFKGSMQEAEDKMASSLSLDPCCVAGPNPLSSPRSPLASVFEAQPSHGTPGASTKLKGGGGAGFGGAPKGGFHPCAKRATKPIKSIPSSSDRFPVVPPTTAGQRLKLFPKKLKKKAPLSDEAPPKPTTSHSSLQWGVIRKPLKMGAELEASSPLNPRVKKRKKGARKSI